MIQLKQPFKSLKASSDCRLGNFIFYPSLILKFCKHCSETFFQYEKQFQFFTESGNLKNLKLRLYLRFEICPKTSNLPKHNKNRAHQISEGVKICVREECIHLKVCLYFLSEAALFLFSH